MYIYLFTIKKITSAFMSSQTYVYICESSSSLTCGSRRNTQNWLFSSIFSKILNMFRKCLMLAFVEFFYYINSWNITFSDIL